VTSLREDAKTVPSSVFVNVDRSGTCGSSKNPIDEASEFFVDAFWTAKVGGGTRQLSDRQRRSLLQSQRSEFSRRYCSGGGGKKSDLLLCRSGGGKRIVACAGVEVDSVPEGSLKGSFRTQAPLMSNLAVSRDFRRRGLAELLVQKVEDLCRDWGYEECYLYVEQCNPAAIKLYRKLGYRQIWTDDDAKTLLPTSDGGLQSKPTVIVCMKKNLSRRGGGGPFFWPPTMFG